MTATIVLSILMIASTVCSAESTCDSLLQIKNKVYGFRPRDLSDSLMDLKSKELDTFWDAAKTNPVAAAECLKSMIEKETSDSYFCFDASALLLQLDTTTKYFPTIVAGMKKTNLDDIQLSIYLQLCFYMGLKGQDIGDLTTTLISIPNAKVDLRSHFITLDAIYASIFLFNVMPVKTAEDVLISAINNGNATAKHNGAVVLTLIATDNGDSILNSLLERKVLADSTVDIVGKYRAVPPLKEDGTATREKVLESLHDVPYNFEKEFYGFAGNADLIASACRLLNKGDQELIRDARSRSTPGLSDEALHEYFALTRILMIVRAKNN